MCVGSFMYVSSVFLLYVYLVYFRLFGLLVTFFIFFFSSRRRHTRCLSDWSSDVCSSDLGWPTPVGAATPRSPDRDTPAADPRRRADRRWWTSPSRRRRGPGARPRRRGWCCRPGSRRGR